MSDCDEGFEDEVQRVHLMPEANSDTTEKSPSLLEASRKTRAECEASLVELEKLHFDMLREIGMACSDKTIGYYGPQHAGGAWELAGVAKPKIADLTAAALLILHRASAMFPPEGNEDPIAYAKRLCDWMNARWRERGYR